MLNQLGISLHSIMEKVERIQYQAALAVTGAWQGSSRVKIYEELGWESLTDRRMCRRVLQIHKIIDKKTPFYLREKLPPNRRNLINLKYVFQDIKCRTDRFLNSFFPDAISSWNNIISSFEHFPTFDVLKNHIISLIRPCAKSTFGVFDPSNLRVGLSHLRSHKKRHNFKDTPSDMCLCKQGVEDTGHFLLFCPFYNPHRMTLTNSVDEILRKNNLNTVEHSVQLFLYGHPLINYTDNQIILMSTLKYIKNTNRCGFHILIFALNSYRDLDVLISVGTRSQVFGPLYLMVSMP